jgi:hypothetical protein
VEEEADMQLHQQQAARRGVRRAARARTRLTKGMTGDSPLKAHAPNQPFLHALREGDAPPDARTTAAAIPTPIPRAGCRGQRQPVPAHLVDEAVTAAAACPAPVHSGCKLCHESVRIPYGLRSEITESMESDLLHDRTSHDSIQTNSVMAQYDYGSVCHPYRRATGGSAQSSAGMY